MSPEISAQPPLSEKIAVLLLVVVPLLGGFASFPAVVYTMDFSQFEIISVTVMFIVMALLTGLVGITTGFHRLLTHQSFETYRIIRALITIAGSMAIEGRPFVWCGRHGAHHTHSDQEGDPHSPHHGFGDGVWGVTKGFFHAHMGWMFVTGPPDPDKYIRHLKADSTLTWIDRTFGLWLLVSVFVPPLIVWVITQTTDVLVLAFVVNLMRIGYVHHITWSINSVCHIWGERSFNTTDESRNNWWINFLSLFLGEAWHNNHHAGLRWARHGIKWYQIDLTWYLILAMEKLGLAWNVVRPTEESLARAKARGELK